jgi:peptidoglycan/xylan/chitin deacetylase (PgdA/CDA1 family)
MGLGLQPVIARVTYPLNCLVVRLLPQRKHLVVLTYHRVGTSEELWPELGNLAECTTQQFEQEMDWVRRYCNPVDMATAEAIVHGLQPCPNRAVLVTFDDGYREDLLRALPALRRNAIRPTVFLATDYMDNQRRFWWDRVGVCLQTTTARRLRSGWDATLELPLSSQEERDAAIEVVLDRAKALPAAERDRFISQLEQDLEVASTAESPRPLVLSWEEVHELTADMDFGAHTLSHPVMSSLGTEDARRELTRSKAIVEEQLGRPCSTVAIPYGDSDDYNAETVKLAAEAGFGAIFSLENTLRGPQHVDGSGLALVDRVSLSMAAGTPGVAAKITWPRIFIPDWTGRIQRRLACLHTGS